MWKRIKENFDSGVERVRWFSALLNERMKVEISLFRLLYQSSEIEKRRNELKRSIGDRIFELRHGSERHVLRDPAVSEALHELERLETELDDVRRRAAEIGRIEA